MYTYGGPGGQRAVNQYGGIFDLWFQMLAQNGYIVVCADNRGTEGRGAEFKKVHYLHMGKYALEDQLAVAKYFGAKTYVDESRIGFYGWSYGGYLGLLGLFKGSGTFKAVLSVAPVTHWRFYDTIYTERYMRTPRENPEGYEDWAPVNAVAEWESGKLFLAHGTADDNVHFQNTAELIKSMNSMGKHYDVYFYPDGDHGMGSFWNFYHLFQKMTDFILEEL
ncbi:MAG: prolyl oligopeptidase family serine peptidase, partial [Bacteroidetes bacterium]|nr:prolyl oligopeptidase family serine peptidase [Bacteroidota bacterium]